MARDCKYSVLEAGGGRLGYSWGQPAYVARYKDPGPCLKGEKRGGGESGCHAWYTSLSQRMSVSSGSASSTSKFQASQSYHGQTLSQKEKERKTRKRHVWFCFFLIMSPEEEKLTKHSFLEKVLAITFEPKQDFTWSFYYVGDVFF